MQEAAFGAIQRHEGHIAQYLGYGLLVYFGYPQAHEDDAERAVRCRCSRRKCLIRCTEKFRQRASGSRN